MFEFSSGFGVPESAQFAFTFHSGPSEGPQDDSQSSVPTSDLPDIVPASASTSTPIFVARNTTEVHELPQALTDRLPTEVLEIFFEYLDFGTISKEYLLVCSRVSRRWRAIALPRLFRTMLIHFHGLPKQETSPKEGPASPSRAGQRGYILRSKKEGGYMTKTTKRTSTLEAITRFFSANPQFAAYVRNLHLALALPAGTIWRNIEPKNGSRRVDLLITDEVDREYRNNLPVTDASTLLATLRVFPRLNSLVLYDITLRGPFDLGPHGPIDVPRLRLNFTGRKGEEAPLAEYVNVLGLFRTVDELRIDSFDDKVTLDAPDALAHTEQFMLSPYIVHIDPLPPAAYAAVAKIVARSPALRYVEIVPVRDPRQQRAAFRPRLCTGTAEEQRLTVVVHLFSGNPRFLSTLVAWKEAAERAWPFVARPGAGPTTLVVARNMFSTTYGTTSMGQNEVARVLGYLDALPGPLGRPLLFCHLLWNFLVPNSQCCLCCAELNAARARASTGEFTNMLAQLVQHNNYPEGCHNALDVVRGLGMGHDQDKVRPSCLCGPPLPNARTSAKSQKTAGT